MDELNNTWMKQPPEELEDSSTFLARLLFITKKTICAMAACLHKISIEVTPFQHKQDGFQLFFSCLICRRYKNLYTMYAEHVTKQMRDYLVHLFF